MKLRKLFTWLLLVCLVFIPLFALSEGDGEPSGGSSEPETISQDTKNESGEEPPSEQTSAAPETQAPEQGTATPEPQATDAPGTDPATTPAQEASPSPDVQPTEEPSETPEPSSTKEPSQEPSPTPTVTDAVNISVEGQSAQVDGVWMIQLSDPTSGPAFTWSYPGEVRGYTVKVDSKVIEEETTDTRITLSEDSYAVDTVSELFVGAILEDGSVVWGSLKFKVTGSGGGFPGGFPGGGRFPGGFSGGMSGGISGEEPGFRVTPGTALTDTHASGTKDMTIYRSVELSAEGAVDALVQNETKATLTMGGAERFFATVDGEVLTLVPEGSGDSWRFAASMLKGFANSGITEIRFTLPGGEYALSTDFALSGEVWGRLRSQGIVSGDCLLTLSDEGMTAEIGEGIYEVNGNGELRYVAAKEV